jgi:hypothetical protein
MTREERDRIVLALLNERPIKAAARKRVERPADAKTIPEPVKEEKPKPEKKSTTAKKKD